MDALQTAFYSMREGGLKPEKNLQGGGGIKDIFWNDTMVLKPWFLPTNVTPAKSFKHQKSKVIE